MGSSIHLPNYVRNMCFRREGEREGSREQHPFGKLKVREQVEGEKEKEGVG